MGFCDYIQLTATEGLWPSPDSLQAFDKNGKLGSFGFPFFFASVKVIQTEEQPIREWWSQAN
jgi:hypothetical protein